MQIIPSHLIFWPELGCLYVPQVHVLHDCVGSLGLFLLSLATLTLPHSQRMFHSSLQRVLFQRCELQLEPWLLSRFFFMYLVTFEISADTFKSMFTLQHLVSPWDLLFFLYFLLRGVIPSFLASKQRTTLSLTFQVQPHEVLPPGYLLYFSSPCSLARAASTLVLFFSISCPDYCSKLLIGLLISDLAQTGPGVTCLRVTTVNLDSELS